MRIMNKSIYISILLMVISVSAQATSLYVTDRIYLGVHQQASEDSPVLESIPSGTAVELLGKQDNFTKVKLINGVEGWVSSQYLMNEQPSTAKYDKLFSDYQKSKETLKSVNETLTKRERDIQILRDELSNAKTTIREAKKGGKVVNKVDPEQEKKLQDAEQRIQELTKELENIKKSNEASTNQNDVTASLKFAEEENVALQARIALAISNLSGEKAPTPEELAGIRPQFPLWYWLLMLVMLVIGIGGGVAWMDHQIRRRHGGFRV